MVTTYGLIPAAGLSTRMGRPKLALPLGDRTVLECVIEALRQGGLDHILLVLGPETAPYATMAQIAGAETLTLPEQTPEMRATVTQGLACLERGHQPRDEDAWLLAPADHPTVQAAVVHALLAARAEHPEYSIFVPTFEKRRGHPTLCSWKHARKILQEPPDHGLNVYFRRHSAETLEISWPTPEILWDVDTPEDYQRLLEMVSNNLPFTFSVGGAFFERST